MAQLVSREHLLQLLKADGKVEESENTFSYKDFCKVHTEYIENGKHLDRLNDLDNGEDAYMYAYSEVKSKYLKKNVSTYKICWQWIFQSGVCISKWKVLEVAV